MTDLIAFSKDLSLWRNIGSSFTDILAVANDSDVLEWHVTISKFSNGNEYKFHFFILWHIGFPKIQPKISLLFGQRCMVESPRFFDNWVFLDNHLSLYSITAVLLNLRKIVKRINTDLVDVTKFNSQNCVRCNFGQTQISTTQDNNDNNIIKNDKNNLSSSNLSVGSLTISSCTDHSFESTINTHITHKQIENDKIISLPMVIDKDDKPKLATVNQEIVTKVEKNIKVKNKNNSKKVETEKVAVRYLEVNENGKLVFKWSEGRIPNEI